MRLALTSLACVFVLAACGGESDTAPEAAATSPTAATTVDVDVVLIDSLPVDALFNSDDDTCTSRNIQETLSNAFGGNDDAEPTGVTVTLQDAGGEIIGSTDLSSFGGEFDKSAGCTWPVSFNDVPAGDFFQVTVEGYEFETDASGPAGEPLEVRF